MFGDVGPLVASLSAEHNHVPANCVEQLEAVGLTLTVTVNQPELVFSSSLEAVGSSLSGKQQAAAKKIFVPLIKEAAEKAKAKFDKHIPVITKYLTRRMRWDPRNKPVELPSGSYSKEFFGCLPEMYGTKIIAQYAAYVRRGPQRYSACSVRRSRR